MMKFQSSSSARGLLIGALITVAVNENAAVAQEPRTQGQFLGDVRVGLFGGAFIPHTIQFTGQGALSTIPFSASGKISMDPSAAVGGFIGYTVNEYVNIEGNLGYSSGNLNEFTGKLDLGPFGSTTGKFPLRGSTSVLAGFVNVMFDPFGIGELTPYIGAGPGFAVLRTETRSLLVNGTTLPINSQSKNVGMAADILVGVDIRVHEKLELGFAYQYFWIDSGSISSPTLSGRRGGITGQVVGLLFEYHL